MSSQIANNTLTQIAIKAVSKRLLFDALKASIASTPVTLANFPIAALKGNWPITYRCAIALKLAASESIAASTIANQLVEVIRGQQDVKFFPGVSGQFLSALPWVVHADDQGWILLTLCDQGIADWLAYLNELTLFPSSNQSEQSEQSAPNETNIPNQSGAAFRTEAFPRGLLCSQLQLSLPMLLQFGHARCCAWLRHADPASYREQPLPFTSEQPPVGIPWGWSSDSPIPCHTLLCAIVQVLDTLADRRGDRTTCLRQGYVLVEAIYTFQAMMPLGTIHTLPTTDQIAIWSLTRAAQQILAWIISDVLGQRPAQSF